MNDDAYSGGIDWNAVDIALPDDVIDSSNKNNSNDDNDRSGDTQYAVEPQQHQQQQQRNQSIANFNYQQEQEKEQQQQWMNNDTLQQHHMEEQKQFQSFTSNTHSSNTASSEFHLKQQIEKLQKLLAEKDSKLFDLESSIVMIEAEANYNIKKAQRDAANELNVTQDELRRAKKEVDSKMLTIAKLKKRKFNSNSSKSDIGSGSSHHVSGDRGGLGNKVTSSSSSTSRTATMSMNVNNNFNTTLNKSSASRQHSSNINDKGHIEFMDTSTEESNILQSKNNVSSVSPIHETNDRMQDNNIVYNATSTSAVTTTSRSKAKMKISRILFDNRALSSKSQSQFAVHLLNHFEISYHKVLDVVQLEKSKDEEESLKDPLPFKNETNFDIFKIRNLLQLYITSENEAAIPKINTASATKRPVSISSIIKELICLFVAKMEYNEERISIPSIDSLQTMYLALSLLHEICTISMKARRLIRQWVCVAHDGSTTITEKNKGIAPQHHSSGSIGISNSQSICTSSRIRGHSLMQRNALKHSSIQIRNVFQDLENDDSSNHSVWEEGQPILICHEFMRCLTHFVCSKNPFQMMNRHNASESKLIAMLSIQSAIFFLIITHDAPTDTSFINSTCASSCERIWMVLFNCFFPTTLNEDDIGSSSEQYLDFFFEAITKHRKVISRQNFLLQRKHNSSPCHEHESIELDEDVTWRRLLMQLLYHLVRSSKCVRRTIFQRSVNKLNSNYPDDIVFSRRLFSVMLDDLHLFLLPQMMLLRNDTKHLENYERITNILDLVWYMTRVIVELCRIKSGQIIMLTQMKVGSSNEEAVSDSISGVAILVDLLEAALYALVLDSFKQQLNGIIRTCITFFYQLLASNQEKIKVDGQKTMTFKLILNDADRLKTLQSCCKIFVSFNSQAPDVEDEICRKRATMILQCLY